MTRRAYSDRVRLRLRNRLHTIQTLSDETGLDRKVTAGFITGLRSVSTTTLDRLVEWLEEEDRKDKALIEGATTEPQEGSAEPLTSPSRN